MLKENVSLEGKTVLVTGAAGFIGANLVRRLLSEVKDIRVVGIDSITDYYDVNIKYERLREIEALAAGGTRPDGAATPGCCCAEGADVAAAGAASDCAEVSAAGAAAGPDGGQTGAAARWRFVRGSIAEREIVERVFGEERPAVVVNLAAQAGVRYSITNPDSYIESNIIGFYNILEACRHHAVEHLVYASSSSVYGSNAKVPYSTEDKVDNPVSLYAATKKSNELMAHAYSKLYDIPSTGLRFFTVYGPAGRPDMAYFGFTDKLRAGETIRIFNYGNCRRDFTYIDDIVEGVVRVMRHAPERKTGEDGLPVPPYKVYNIGNSNPENLLDFVTILQEELVAAGVLPEDYDFEAHKELVPMQPGDVPVTFADTAPLEEDFGFRPDTSLREGLRRFARWYASYYGT
ncbi:MAG: NAD-dependent epimerase/dehydratase family protein [Bacteroidales bacterium]|nr:NAD-dependent epimerase/dehydratase family protein [Bacteroidales bacterium]